MTGALIIGVISGGALGWLSGGIDPVGDAVFGAILGAFVLPLLRLVSLIPSPGAIIGQAGKGAGSGNFRTVGELLNRKDVLILDTETTGLGQRAEMVEIAILDTTGATRYSAPVMPKGPIGSEASAIHGLTRKDLRKLGAQPWTEHHDDICDLLQGASAVVGWNVSFDIRILDQTAEKYSLVVPGFDFFDMLGFYRDIRKRKHNRLGDAMHAEQLRWAGKSHRAESDCRAVLAIMNKLADETF